MRLSEISQKFDLQLKLSLKKLTDSGKLIFCVIVQFPIYSQFSWWSARQFMTYHSMNAMIYRK